MNSKQKGNRREREFAQICRNHGFEDARRTQQFCGNTTEDASDVVGLPYIHCEVKGTQATSFNQFLKQAKRDSEKKNRDEIPVVFYKRNNQPWMAVLDLEDWFEMYKAYREKKDGSK